MGKLKILCDVDDTAWDLCSAWTAALNERYGTNVSKEEITDWDISKAFSTLTVDQILGILQEDDFWENVKPVPGAVETLGMFHDIGHEIYMVTATDCLTCKAKFEHLFKMFPFMDSKHIIIAHDKQMICGDVMIDDNPKNLMWGPYLRVLFTKPHNRAFNNDEYVIFRADDWQQVTRIIREHLLHETSYTNLAPYYI